MKVLLVFAVLLLAALANAETCGDGGYCDGEGRCCRTATSYKCAPEDNVVCCPGGDYSCPKGKSCVKFFKWFVCVRLGAPTDIDGTNSVGISYSKANPNTMLSFD
nr:uncharacterized protein LOC107453869 [Parasteatoda tepidariorum]